MYYVMSNIHGNKEKFDRMLELIKFDEKEDYLYILGDTVDYGKDGIKILLDISMRPNVYHLLGEHEAKARDMIKRFVMISSNNLKPDPEFIASFRKWTMEEGGMPTFEAFSALNEEMREGILDYFDEMFPYDEIFVDSRSYFLCHAGIAGYSAGKPLEDYYEEDFYTFGINSERKYFPDKTIVVGHKPTTEFNDACIYKTTAYINVDCGCAFDGRLACLCLNNGREFYV